MTSELKKTRVLIEVLEREFSRLHERARQLITQTPDASLYSNSVGINSASNSTGTNSTGTKSNGIPAQPDSIGDCILRSAAAVEQTCGGLNSNLWDDPFEWTLPEQLSTTQLVLAYLDEVEATRKHCFARFREDADLFKDVALPSELIEPLLSVLLETLVRASALQGRGFAAAKNFSGV